MIIAVHVNQDPDGMFLLGMIILWWLILQGSGRDR